MPTVAETAYPRLKNQVREKELTEIYTPTLEELNLASQHTRKGATKLGFLVLLKTFQRLGYFVAPTTIPNVIVFHIANCSALACPPDVLKSYDTSGTRWRHLIIIRDYLSINPYQAKARRLIVQSMAKAARTKNDLADIINVAIEELVHLRSHGQPHAQIMTWLGVYQAFTPKLELGDNPTVRLDLDNVPQPDAILMLDGGQAQISTDDYIEGAPELVVEIAASSAAYDLYEKKRVYRRNGVKEYLVWRVYDAEFDWFHLDAGEYIKLEADSKGVISSITFPGLWLAVSSLLSGAMEQVLTVLQQGLDLIEK